MIVTGPPEEVLDLFAVPGVVVPLPGGRTGSVVAGDLVLSPGRDAATQEWLSPVLARLAVTLDTRPQRRRRDLRIAMPVPARDGGWVVRGWGASRYEPDTTACRDLEVTVAAGRLLHAELASAVPTEPPGLAARTDRWTRAERLAFAAPHPLLASAAGLPGAAVVRRVAPLLDDVDLGPRQLVHADLAGNVLLDAAGAPVVLDLTPAWRPVRWAEAITVLDAVARGDATLDVLGAWAPGVPQQAMLRALVFRALSDPGPAVLARYDAVLDVVAST